MKMECIEARALKSSVLSQMAGKPNSQVFNHNDDVWCLTGINNVLSSEDAFPVDDLLNLDFPEKDLQAGFFSQVGDVEKVSEERKLNHSSTTFSGGADDFDSLSAAAELDVPADDLENLEWLSQFVDDSTTGLSLLCPVGSLTSSSGVKPGKTIETTSRPVQNIRVPFMISSVPRKSRSKRGKRPYERRPWYLASSPLGTADSSTTTSSNGSSAITPALFAKAVVLEPDWFRGVEKPQIKKQKMTLEADSGRRCTHCQVNSTPQWRTGPLGPKTLCNACGVRYKSGRLFPEYRPACSPTFSKEMHSNSHRKVLEMRRKKEMVEGS